MPVPRKQALKTVNSVAHTGSTAGIQGGIQAAGRHTRLQTGRREALPGYIHLDIHPGRHTRLYTPGYTAREARRPLRSVFLLLLGEEEASAQCLSPVLWEEEAYAQCVSCSLCPH